MIAPLREFLNLKLDRHTLHRVYLQRAPCGVIWHRSRRVGMLYFLPKQAVSMRRHVGPQST